MQLATLAYCATGPSNVLRSMLRWDAMALKVCTGLCLCKVRCLREEWRRGACKRRGHFMPARGSHVMMRVMRYIYSLLRYGSIWFFYSAGEMGARPDVL